MVIVGGEERNRKKWLEKGGRCMLVDPGENQCLHTWLHLCNKHGRDDHKNRWLMFSAHY